MAGPLSRACSDQRPAWGGGAPHGPPVSHWGGPLEQALLRCDFRMQGGVDAGGDDARKIIQQ